MLGRIVDVSDSNRVLTVVRGALLVHAISAGDAPIGTVPLDDLEAVIVHGRGVTYQRGVLRALSQRGVPLVVCDDVHYPVGVLWPLAGHHEVGRRLDAQLAASRPLQKRLWATIVRHKILWQAAHLERMAPAQAASVRRVARQVRSGDPDNREAYAARLYWPAVFGATFRRDRNQTGVNALLNYGYTCLRAATARAVVAAGLLPALGMHHRHDGNAFRLVDDLVEVWRPFVDGQVEVLHSRGEAVLTPATKAALLQVLYVDLKTADGRTPLLTCIHRLATSLAQVYLGQRTTLDLPTMGPVVEMTTDAAEAQARCSPDTD